MVPLTRQERQVIVFLMIGVLVGTGISYAKKRSVSLRPVFCFDSSYGKININKADKEMLKDIPGVGDTLAQRIIDYRLENGPFVCQEDLRKIKGMNAGRYGRARDMIIIE
jgi:competence ComEA-like helix-hairpin-helix protein